MITSKLTPGAQTTIPKPVRTALGLRPGDEIAYVIENGHAILTRFEEQPTTNDPLASFSEWSSPDDAKTYAKL